MGPLALGTDGGGSVRIPAACCGIVGLKATLGCIPNVHAPDSFANISYIGPMTRTVADNRLLYEVMAGPDPRDVHAIRPFAADQRLPDGPLEDLRVGWMAQVGNRLDPEVLAQAEAIVRLLESMGAAVEPVELDFASLEREFLIILQSGLSARLRRYLPEYAERIDASLRTTIERGSAWSAEELQQAGMARTELFRRLQRDFERYEFLLSPTLSAPALPVTQDAFAPVIVDGESAGQLRGAWYPYTWPFNLTGHPALTIPSGWTATKLPTAVQIVGPFYAEARLFDLAARLESARPWAHQRPPELA
jgi:aspartyl-tRNA(Asn)/glutamyl-tRNA(Gln) amidotransferase subunit A